MGRTIPPATGVFLLLLFSVRVQAGVYFITDTNDTTEVTSLRGAVIHANRHGGDNVIVLGYDEPHRRDYRQAHQRIYHLTIQGADEDAAQTGDLDVTRGDLTIIGVGANVTIAATGLGDRVFHILPLARLTLENLTVTGGAATNCILGSFLFLDRNGEPGGAIYNSGILIMQDCFIVGNSSGNGGFVVVGYSPGGDGGGIYNSGVARLSNCVINSNSAGAAGGPDEMFGVGSNGGSGGGIYNSGKMILNCCTVSANSGGRGSSGGWPYSNGTFTGGTPGGAGGGGGGIYNVGEMELNFCTVNGNSGGAGGNGGDADSGGNGGAGGSGAGILNIGSLSVNTCTISGNHCGIGGNGGGFGYFAWAAGAGGAGGSGGGIFNAGLLQVSSCTIVESTAADGGRGGDFLFPNPSGPPANGGNGGNGGKGGGIVEMNSAASSHIRNTLAALNLAGNGGAGGTGAVGYPPYEPGKLPGVDGTNGSNGSGPDLAGDFTSQGFNLIGVAEGSTGFTNGVNADQVGSIAAPINPLIGPLQMNGGPTPTHALLPGSPAIDQGNCFGIHTDQRGHHRPYNYLSVPNAPGGDGSDIGAFELGSSMRR